MKNRKIYVAVVGGRDYGARFDNNLGRTIEDSQQVNYFYGKVYETLNKISKKEEVGLENIIIVSGGARGADFLAKKYAMEELHENYLEYQAEWENLEVPQVKVKARKDGKLYNAWAGFQRNQKIVNRADYVIAFWDGKSFGTKDTITKTKRAEKPVFIFYYHNTGEEV